MHTYRPEVNNKASQLMTYFITSSVQQTVNRMSWAVVLDHLDVMYYQLFGHVCLWRRGKVHLLCRTVAQRRRELLGFTVM